MCKCTDCMWCVIHKTEEGELYECKATDEEVYVEEYAATSDLLPCDFYVEQLDVNNPKA